MSAPFNDRGPFAVGEVCVVVYSDKRKDLIGKEVEITGPLELILGSNGEEWMGHRTNITLGNRNFCPKESYLRRRKPPATDTGEQLIISLLRDSTMPEGVPA